MLPSTERYGGADLTTLSPFFFFEDGPCDPPVEAGTPHETVAALFFGDFCKLALPPQVRRVADKVERMRKGVIAVHQALDVEKDEPFDSGRSHRLRHVPADPGSANDVQHPAVLEVDEQKSGARVHFQIAESVEEQISA